LPQVALIDLELHTMRLRQVVRSDFHFGANVTEPVGSLNLDTEFRLERFERRSVGLPVDSLWHSSPNRSISVTISSAPWTQTLAPEAPQWPMTRSQLPSSASAASGNCRPCTHNWKPAIITAGGPSSLFETPSNRSLQHHGQCRIAMNELPPS
jgi:hypothetical protein